MAEGPSEDYCCLFLWFMGFYWVNNPILQAARNAPLRSTFQLPTSGTWKLGLRKLLIDKNPSLATLLPVTSPS